MGNLKFGWKRDKQDDRDYKYALHPEVGAGLVLPPSISLLSKMSPVEDQGNLGSCVANALCASLEFLQLNSPFNFGLYSDLSRLFVYFNSRVLDGGDPDRLGDDGTTLRHAVLAIRKWGICREAVWPYVESQVSFKPSTPSYAEALKHQVLSGYRVDIKLQAMKTCLAAGYPFIFGVQLYESFMATITARSGLVPIPDPNYENYVGGHAMTAIGYDDGTQSFLVRNSWGTKWGKSGMCAMPYAYLTDMNLTGDAWTLRMN